MTIFVLPYTKIYIMVISWFIANLEVLLSRNWDAGSSQYILFTLLIDLNDIVLYTSENICLVEPVILRTIVYLY